MKIDHKEDYQQLRRQNYPAVGDQLDALWAIINQLLNKGTVSDPDAAAIAARIQAVKKKFPKK